jgi:hypothetical protein
MTRAEMVLEALAYSPLSNLMRLLAREHFIQFSRRESFKSYKTNIIRIILFVAFYEGNLRIEFNLIWCTQQHRFLIQCLLRDSRASYWSVVHVKYTLDNGQCLMQ